jgi:hypothetical protein
MNNTMKEEIATNGIRKEKVIACNKSEYTKVIIMDKAAEVSQLQNNYLYKMDVA